MRRLGILPAALAGLASAAANGQTAPQWPSWVDLSRGTDLSEDYRIQFGLCDSVNRFRGIQLPQTIGGHYFYGCSSDPSSVTVLRQYPASPGLAGGAVVFTSKLAIDLDGSWYACNTPGHTDQCSTSLTLRDAHNREIGVSSDFVPYVVIPVRGPNSALSREFQTLTNVHVGDVGMVLTATQAIPVIIGDGGPFSKLGEGSIALHRALGRELCATQNSDGACRKMAPHMGSLSGPFVTIVFLGSRISGLTPANIATRTRDQALRYWHVAAPLIGRQP
jgi:hypothetical protein